MRSLFVLIVLAALAMPCAVPVAAGDVFRSRLAVIDLKTADVVLRGARAAGMFPQDLPGKSIPLRRLELDAALRSRLPLHDPWGSDLFYLPNTNGFAIVSPGPDQIFDADDAPCDRRANTEADDLITCEGRLVRWPQDPWRQLRQAMADIRSIGTAIETYSIDNNEYPQLEPPLPDVASPGAVAVPLAAFTEVLTPTYIRRLPDTDPWGNPYRAWSDGEHYFIVSGGLDGLIDWSSDAFSRREARQSTDPAADIVFKDGQFTEWPQTGDYP